MTHDPENLRKYLEGICQDVENHFNSDHMREIMERCRQRCEDTKAKEPSLKEIAEAALKRLHPERENDLRQERMNDIYDRATELNDEAERCVDAYLNEEDRLIGIRLTKLKAMTQALVDLLEDEEEEN